MESEWFFVWPWNENAPTKQKQQTNGNKAIWLVYRTDTKARGKKIHARELSGNQSVYLALTSYYKTIGQSNNASSIIGFSLAGKRRVYILIFFIHWLIKQITNTYRNHFSRSYKNRSIKKILNKFHHRALTMIMFCWFWRQNSKSCKVGPTFSSSNPSPSLLSAATDSKEKFQCMPKYSN